MCEARGPGLVVLALALLLVGGCAPSATVGPQRSSTTGDRSSAEGPTNFAHPDDMIKRYPTMRHQDL